MSANETVLTPSQYKEPAIIEKKVRYIDYQDTSFMTGKSVDPLTWAEVSLESIQYNLEQIRKLAAQNRFDIPPRHKHQKNAKTRIDILAVIKSDAYGHGMIETGRCLDQLGVDFFAVSDVKEGIRLREAGLKKKILALENALPEFAQQICQYDLIPTVGTIDLAERLNEAAHKAKKRISIQIEVDTGMGRLGIWHQTAFEFIKTLFHFRHLTVDGIFTHFPAADTDRQFTQQQIDLLYKLVLKLDKAGMIIPYIHAANSLGLTDYKTKVLNLVRPGLMLYGLYPSEQSRNQINLKPALSVRSKVIFVKEVAKGRSLSYGRTFIASEDMTVATVPIGYNDGYGITLSNKSSVIIGNKRCPVVGRVTMDQIMVDISAVSNPKLGMPVTILGTQSGQNISANELAQWANTINYEIVCNLGNRLPRVYR